MMSFIAISVLGGAILYIWENGLIGEAAERLAHLTGHQPYPLWWKDPIWPRA